MSVASTQTVYFPSGGNVFPYLQLVDVAFGEPSVAALNTIAVEPNALPFQYLFVDCCRSATPTDCTPDASLAVPQIPGGAQPPPQAAPLERPLFAGKLMLTAGAEPAISHVNVAGTLGGFEPTTASTWNVCVPAARPAYVLGEPHGA